MSKCLITGNCGFLGSALQENLEMDGWEVTGLDNMKWSTRKMKNTVVGDVRNKQLVNGLVSGVDVVVHTAAQINVDYGNLNPDETININIKGTLNVLEACRKFKKKLVFASSSEIYGSAQTDKISEDHPLDAQSVYAATKVAGDRLCKSYKDTFDMDISILRNFNAFGFNQRCDSYGGVIAIFVSRVLRGEPPIVYGTGEQQRDYIWIDDAIEGYRLAIYNRLDGPLNIATGECVRIKDIAEMVIELCGADLKVEYTDARPGEVMRLQGDITRARAMGFNPTTNFKKHLKSYIDWYKEEMNKL